MSDYTNSHFPDDTYDGPGREAQLARLIERIALICRGEMDISPFGAVGKRVNNRFRAKAKKALAPPESERCGANSGDAAGGEE